jgi:cytochrome P450
LLTWVTSNIIAGSDTTAIFLRTIFYNLLKDPRSMKLLLNEIDDAAKADRLSDLVSWKEARELPYLDACIKEAGRIHPPFGLPLERVVHPEGAVICGEHLKGGTVVGINAWVVHRDKETFGEDCDEWRPDRWLEADEKTRSKMEHGLLTVRLDFFLMRSPRYFRGRTLLLTFAPSSSVPDIAPVLARTSAISRSISLSQRFYDGMR